MSRNPSINAMTRTSVLAYCSQLFGTAVRFLVQFWLARHLGASSYGRFVLARGWGELVSKLPNGGHHLTLLRHVPLLREQGRLGDARAVLSWAVRRTVMIAAGASAAGSLLAILLADQPMIWIGAALLVTPIAMLMVADAGLRSLGRLSTAMAIGHVLQPLLFVAALAMTAPTDIGATSSLWILVGCFVVSALVMTRTLHRHVADWPTSGNASAGAWPVEEMWLFSGQLASVAINSGGLLTLGIVAGVEAAAVYAIAARLAGIGRLATATIESTAAPELAVAREEAGRDTAQRVVHRAIRLAVIPAVGALIGGALFGRVIFGWFGDDFRGGYSILIILLFANMIEGFTGPVGFLMSSAGSVRTYALTLIGHAIGLVAITILFAALWGGVGAAIAYTLATVSWNVALVMQAGRSLNVWCIPSVREQAHV